VCLPREKNNLSPMSSGRVCYGMDLEPRYCDVILARWEAATGVQPKVISAVQPKKGIKGTR